ncbi:MAG: hypothetical protein FWG62_01245 [Proteobacteria bacterium]|nr:hypothetical protein [Pseudomonadota bacterium]
MRKIPCELTLGNGGDVVVMVELNNDGTLKIPRHALYGSFKEGVLSCRVMRPEDQTCVQQEIWVD